MTSLVLGVLMVLTLAAAERGTDRLAFAAAAFATLVAALLLVAGDFERAILLASILTMAIAGASQVKHHHSGIKLTAADLALVYAGTLRFLVTQYRRAALGVLAGATALVVAIFATLLLAEGAPLPFELRLLLLALALLSCALAYRMSGGAEGFRRGSSQRKGYFSTFVASFIDVPSWRGSRGLSMLDVGETPLPLLPAKPASSTMMPDILVIQHESLFDPRSFGLAIEPGVEMLLSPANGLSGHLNVDIYGGGSWQSEFSLLTGLSSATFGPDAYFIFRRGAGRFHHSLPRLLGHLGYRTTLVSSCRRRFLDYDAFYRSIGVEERLFSDELPRPFDVDHFERTSSDGLFLEAVGDAYAARTRTDSRPRFLYALTNFNHGPHDRRRVARGKFEAERTFALASLPDAQFGEFYARLAESAASWQRLKSQLAALSPGRPLLVVHYGDHQPVMTRRIERALRLPEDARRQFRTFFAIEALNFEMARPAVQPGSVLDIAFLGTIALQAAGLPIDRVSSTRASLIADCGEAYYLSDSERKRRFHRALVDLGLIELAAVARPRPMLPEPIVER
jgi:hypothetical protein